MVQSELIFSFLISPVLHVQMEQLMLDLLQLEFVQVKLQQLWEVQLEEVLQQERGLAGQVLGQTQAIQAQLLTPLAQVSLET